MNRPRCPGQDMRFWKPEDIFCVQCPWCGDEIEFWKDEPIRMCACGREVRNPRLDMGCAQWCKFSAECLGVEHTEMPAKKSVRDQMLEEVKNACEGDPSRMDQIFHTLDYAEQILEVGGGDSLIVRAAAILHDFFNPEVETHSEHHSDEDGSSRARAILTEAGVPPDAIERILEIIGSLHRGIKLDSLEYGIVSDAVTLADFSCLPPSVKTGKATALKGHTFFTPRGRQIATRFLSGTS
ncbi:MAG: HD domain-containing protein [Candidatus Hydrogenedentes bacterium]|nr:HD domain-containing protein [Candidatus Hydrogenedentota bacterium]